MNETNDPLEAELASFRPRELSPAFQRRIAGRLADPGPNSSRRRWGIALACGLAAACLAAVLLGPWGGQDVDTRRAIVGPRPASQDRAGNAMVPSLQAYRQALARSSEDLDALLDKHAARPRKPSPQLVRTLAFTRSVREFKDFTGGL